MRNGRFAGRRGRARARRREAGRESSSFLPALPPSTCSKAMPIAAINFVPSSTPCQNKHENAQTSSDAKNCAPPPRAAPSPVPEDGLRRNVEPNMKLSRALLIVLVLHVVAVAGIIAFNAIKTRRRSPSRPTAKERERENARLRRATTVPRRLLRNDRCTNATKKRSTSTAVQKRNQIRKGEAQSKRP